MRGFKRPKATVLPDTALVPAANLVAPPKHFTHELRHAQPYFYAAPQHAHSADGQLEAGSSLLLREQLEGGWCAVVDGRGLCVITAQEGLFPLRSATK
jgi:hypothetical protein